MNLHDLAPNKLDNSAIMGGMLAQPITEKGSQQGEGLGLKYGLSSMQGWRPQMEDTHDIKLGLKYGLDDWSFFAVFDGHAGKCAADYAAYNLLDHILKDSKFELGVDNWPESTEEKPPSPSDPSPKQSSNPSVDSIQSKTEPKIIDTTVKQRTSDDYNYTEPEKTSKNAPLEPNPPDELTETEKYMNRPEVPKTKFATFPVLQQLDMVKDAIRSGFLSIDQKMRSTSEDMSGCTAVCALISPTHLFIANCGDSRAVLYDGNLPRFATEDHKPFHPIERKRIIDAGGTATQRVNGTLAVSRALGDFEFKKDELRGSCEQLVSPEPEVTVLERHPTDEFLILACDGIWDVMNNIDICEFVRYKLKIEPNLTNVCSSVLDVCLRKGSRDNMSIIIVVFENGPKVNQEAIKRDEDNDKRLLEYAEQLQEQYNLVSFEDFLDYLGSEMPNADAILPPGAGVEAKYDILRENYDKNHEGEETPAAEE